MDAARARRLVQDTFQQAFDRGRFEAFLRELLNRFEPKPLHYRGQMIREAFREHVASLERIGTYAASGGEKIDLLVVRLTGESKLARARTALRNYAADYLKTRGAKDAALVAFVSPAEKTWRFSYVRMEYGTTTDDRGRVGTTTELTPARRLSYLVGEGESCHTAQSRFLDLLQRTSLDPAIEELEAAFSVEAITKEFFEQYKALFLNLKEQLDAVAKRDRVVGKEFAARKIDTVDFAKKLMGQIVFLYFLQKKGWLGVGKGQPWGTGPSDFIRRLTRGEFGVKGNVFNDILEPLFYDTLATDRGSEAWCPRFKCRIPFLNGGLFEPLGGYDWIATDIVIPDDVFTNKETTPAGDVGTGILDVFDRYNFTVNEAEPLEVEVAIDPEMLGKVFENLLEVRERKSKGSFYTPREIVHYMCQESLINYLADAVGQGDAPLVAEPAVQVGLFAGVPPRQGSLRAACPEISREDLVAFIRSGEQAAHYEAARKDGTKSYSRELPKSIEKHAPRIDEALSAVTVCDPAIGSGAFPVGMMAEIVRARTTLTPYLGNDAGRSPYDFKRHAIQACLYGVDIDSGAVEIAKLRLWLSLVVDEEDVRSINPLPNLDFKIVGGDSLSAVEKNLFNSPLFEGLEALKPKFFDETNRRKKTEYREKIETLIHQLTKGREAFDFEIYFSEVFHVRRGFDVVIGNPPYIGFQGFMDQKEALERRYSSARGRFDYYVPFVEQGIRLLRRGGVLAYICPTNFTKRDYGQALRKLLLAETQLVQMSDFGDSKIFDGALNYTGIFILRKGQARAGHSFQYQEGTITSVARSVSQATLSGEPWVFQDAPSLEIVEAIRRAVVTPLEKLAVGISEGIVTGQNEVFLLAGERARSLGLEDEFVRPCLRGREIRRYGHEPAADVVIYPYSLQAGKTRAIAADVLMRTAPTLWAYLRNRRQELTGRDYFDRSSKEWYELWCQRDLSQLASAKIVVPELADRSRFAYAAAGVYYGDTACGITLRAGVPEDLHYVLAILNSRLLDFYYRRTTVPKANGFLIYKTMFLKNVPIARVDFSSGAARSRHDRLVALAKEALRRIANDRVTTDVDSEIDRIVYEVYGLTKAAVEGIERHGDLSPAPRTGGVAGEGRKRGAARGTDQEG